MMLELWFNLTMILDFYDCMMWEHHNGIIISLHLWLYNEKSLWVYDERCDDMMWDLYDNMMTSFHDSMMWKCYEYMVIGVYDVRAFDWVMSPLLLKQCMRVLWQYDDRSL